MPGILIQRGDTKEFNEEKTETTAEHEILPESHSISGTLTIKQTKAEYYKPSQQEEQILTELANYQEFLPTSVGSQRIAGARVSTRLTRKFETDGIISTQEKEVSIIHIQRTFE